MNILRIVLAILLPPLAVFLTVGVGMHFWINILLTILAVVPGMIHALWVIVKKGTVGNNGYYVSLSVLCFDRPRVFSRSYLSSTAE